VSSGWRIEFDRRARKELLTLGSREQGRVIAFLEERVLALDDPRDIGEPLSHEFKGIWRYRVGDYRVLCRIEDDRLVVLVVAVGHRGEVYRG
jgi:mRNA interferase RelE/StbE